MATRVYELAKELGIEAKVMVKKLNEIGIKASNHMNAISDEDCEKVRKMYKENKSSGGSAPAEKKASAANPKEKAKKQDSRAAKGADGDEKNISNGQNSIPKQQPSKQGAGGKNDNRQSTNQAQNRDKNNRPAGNAGSAGNAGNAANAGNASNAGSAGSRKPGSVSGQDNRRVSNASGQDNRRASNASGQDNRRTNNAGGQNNRKSVNAGGAGNRGAGFTGGSHADRRDNRSSGSQTQHQNRSNRRNNDRNNSNGYGSGSSYNNNNSKHSNMSKPGQRSKRDREHRKEQRKEEARRAEEMAAAIPADAVVVTVPITVKGLAEQIDVAETKIIMTLMKNGIMANVNQNLDGDIVQILGDELGKKIIIGEIEEEEEEEGIENFTDRDEDLKPRPPVITVMGHVDHGKTSLLDKIRHSSVTSSESGGITQHIGASEITHEGQRIVFLDTPGHEAFTAMRARGAYITDIAVLVVAADDSVKPQTVEAISHAKAAGVPVIVAINKIDKPGANLDKVRQDLAENGLLVEDWGGDIISVPVSAKTGEGIDTLLEMILLQAEMLELRANPDRLALGTVIEAKLDKQKGPIATLLIQNGTLHAGMSVVAGNCSGRIRAMTNFKGGKLKKAGPATAVSIIGLSDVPEAGDSFNAVSTDKIAREIAENRKNKQRDQIMQKTASATLEQFFNQLGDEVKELNLIVKADVMGSVGALVSSLEKIKEENAVVKIIHKAAGTITEGDVTLASTTGAIIIGFNVRPTMPVASAAQREGVEIRTYSVIYEVIDDVKAALKGMLDPEFKEQVLGNVEVRDTFKVPNVGVIAGGYVLDGKVERNAGVRVVREGIVIHEGKISSLRRFKDDVKEVNHGFECGIGIENYNDLKVGDIIEAYKMIEVERK